MEVMHNRLIHYQPVTGETSLAAAPPPDRRDVPSCRYVKS